MTGVIIGIIILHWLMILPVSLIMRSLQSSRLKDDEVGVLSQNSHQPSQDAKELMAYVISEDDGFSWTHPKFY